jgi:NADH dehydrogenase [ubiquinone] 1 alpha subcomplex assembly factor 7
LVFTLSFKEKLIDHIKLHGPITVAEYMERCVAHYYAARDPFGAGGDFVTAPEISQIFGELVGAWLEDRWQHVSGSQAVLCELGPGRGTLMKDILRVTRNSGLHESADVRLVEASPVLRELQRRTLHYAHMRISWHDTLAGLPPLPLFLVANEFFDALPVHQYLEREERKIGLMMDQLAFMPNGRVIRETSPASAVVMAQIAAHIGTYGGAALIMDYGYDGAMHGDSVQAVKAHRFIHPLDAPGESDITAHVDFAALKEAAAPARAHVWGAAGQGDFLNALGAQARLAALCKTASPEQCSLLRSGVERLVSMQQMGGLFKIMAVTSGDDKPPGF